jgi:hypothetical protein
MLTRGQTRSLLDSGFLVAVRKTLFILSQIGDARDNVAVADRQIDDTRDDDASRHRYIQLQPPTFH